MSKKITAVGFQELVHVDSVSSNKIVYYYENEKVYVLHKYNVMDCNVFAFLCMDAPASGKPEPEIRETTFRGAVVTALGKKLAVYCADNYSSFLEELTQLPF